MKDCQFMLCRAKTEIGNVEVCCDAEVDHQGLHHACKHNTTHTEVDASFGGHNGLF